MHLHKQLRKQSFPTSQLRRSLTSCIVYVLRIFKRSFSSCDLTDNIIFRGTFDNNPPAPISWVQRDVADCQLSAMHSAGAICNCVGTGSWGRCAQTTMVVQVRCASGGPNNINSPTVRAWTRLSNRTQPVAVDRCSDRQTVRAGGPAGSALTSGYPTPSNDNETQISLCQVVSITFTVTGTSINICIYYISHTLS